MKRIISYSILIVFSISAWAQKTKELQLQPLQIYGTVTDKKIIDDIKTKDVVKNSPFFFTQRYQDNYGLFLFEKKKDKWIVYNYDEYVSNYQIQKHSVHSNRYVSIDVSKMASGSGENYYGWFVIFDLEQRKYLSLQTYSYNSGSDYKHVQKCSSKVTYINAGLKISRTCKTPEYNYCDNCVSSGIYNISGK